MSYKDFSQLNAAVSQYRLDPDANIIRRIVSEIEEMGNIARSLPVDWARAYAGVMVLKYASDGTPTDVTESVTVNGVNAPDSLISDLKRRFYDIYNSYLKDVDEFNRNKLITVDNYIGNALPLADFPGSYTFATVGCGNYTFNIGLDASSLYIKFDATPFSTVSINENKCRGFAAYYPSNTSKKVVEFNLLIKWDIDAVMRYLSGKVVLYINSSNFELESDIVYGEPEQPESRNSRFNETFAGYTMGDKRLISPNSNAVSFGSNLTYGLSNLTPADVSSIIMINSQNISDLKTAIDNL